jgi:outer membrane protein
MKKNIIQSGLLGLALLASASTVGAADLKIGVVDMSKVFDSYYKTVQANILISNEIADIQKTLNSMVADADKTKDAMLKADAKKDDMSIPAEEREKNRKAALDKADEYRNIQSDIQQYNEREKSRLEEKRSQRFDTIVGEIRAELNQLAKKSGYTLVLDKSGKAISGVPVVLYTDGENDMTEALIKDLNATAPPTPTSTPAPTPPAGAAPALSPPDSRLLPTPGNR